jgi:hypothetical protein
MNASPQVTMDRAFDAICMLLMPFFLTGASDDPEMARAAAADLLHAYDPVNPQELDLAARAIGFSAAALDNLRLSMAAPVLSDTQVLRYRSTAVNLSRSSEQCRAILKKIQAERPQQQAGTRLPKSLPRPLPPMTAARIEKARAEARDMLAGLARLGSACPAGHGMTATRIASDPCAHVSAALTAALGGGPHAPTPWATR